MKGRELTSSTVSDGVYTFSLPVPTSLPPDLYEKSHAQRQQEGHISRPLDPFFLFRADVLRQQTSPVNGNIPGKLWSLMTAKQKAPWVEMAKSVPVYQKRQEGRHPHYGGASGEKQTTRRFEEPPKKAEVGYSNQPTPEFSLTNGSFFSRSSSCPPGEEHTSQSTLDSSVGYGAPITTRDDLSRRPGTHVTLYQSGDYMQEVEPPKPGAPPTLFQGPSLFTTNYYDIQPPHIPGLGQLAYEPQPWDNWTDANDSRMEGLPQYMGPFSTSALPPLPQYGSSPTNIRVRDATQHSTYNYPMLDGRNHFSSAQRRR
ncbi:uncharacterized protein LACBIDRAFT_293565 [Laccaria bicolor S238N-H82]|uniref:Predicted protein n=1 Tax=Laccaria bicolor (strain S238N-H82 / ATCC MYA-4686) TaxID=486041 RepID=B0D484_LACBS|nr:uncharacterized protein LACBIDRAFT_293565 [Laccaria bicolor S238N-H82]EDR10286.1 predicted protein [Laccaria bicolor S238N-H82]|eukprot:XP_001878736.1 predicted protein [Laccaria bicolor S238N-H82]